MGTELGDRCGDANLKARRTQMKKRIRAMGMVNILTRGAERL